MVEVIPDLEIGKAAEHLVVADLILSGYRAYLTEQGLPYDVVIDYEGRLYRVQVKATRYAKRMPARGAVGMGYLYNVRRSASLHIYRSREKCCKRSICVRLGTVPRHVWSEPAR